MSSKNICFETPSNSLKYSYKAVFLFQSFLVITYIGIFTKNNTLNQGRGWHLIFRLSYRKFSRSSLSGLPCKINWKKKIYSEIDKCPYRGLEHRQKRLQAEDKQILKVNAAVLPGGLCRLRCKNKQSSCVDTHTGFVQINSEGGTGRQINRL